MSLQITQQSHFDWYAHNSGQSYSDYENTPFWTAADKVAFDPWQNDVEKGSWLLDVGCAQGRSAFNFIHKEVNIVGIDISKRLVRQAVDRYHREDHLARASFIAADASMLPVRDCTMDVVLVYGVLHHLPDPLKSCGEVGRVLKNGGVYLGSENNDTAFRKLFDLFQKMVPQWSEEAGPKALFSRKYLEDCFRASRVKINTRTSVYLPPHILNLLSKNAAYRCLAFFDKIGQAIPFLRDNGGLIHIRGKKQCS